MVHGFARRAWGGFFVNLMGGLLYAVTGLLMVTHPGIAAVTLTFMIAMLLIVAGTFRIFVAFSTPIHHRGWLVLNGVISLFLGFSIMSSWPVSGLWVIGLFIGIDMIFDGWTEVMLALSTGSGGGACIRSDRDCVILTDSRAQACGAGRMRISFQRGADPFCFRDHRKDRHFNIAGWFAPGPVFELA